MEPRQNSNATSKTPSYLWASRSLLVIAGAGILGCVFFFSEDLTDMPTSSVLLDLLFYGGIAAGIFCLVRLYGALDRDASLSEELRARFKNSVMFTGPAGALEVVIHFRRTNRKE